MHDPAGIPQWLAAGDLPHVDGRDEGMGMSGLIVPLDMTPAALADDRANATQIAIEEVDAPAVYGEPASAVDPRAPATDRSHARGRPGVERALTVVASEAISSGRSAS